MNIVKTGTKRSWELRQLSMMADRVNIGLGLMLEGGRDFNFIQEGITFCNSLIEGLDTEDYTTTGESWASITKSAVLRDREQLDDLKGFGIDSSKLRDLVEEIKKTLEKLSLGKEEVNTAKIEDLQDKIYHLSMMFYKADVVNLRRLKNKRSLKAYG